VPNAPRIELPRPAIIAALGALILAATFVATQSKTAGTSAPSPSVTTSTATTPQPATTHPKPHKPVQPRVKPGQGLPAAVATALDRHQVVVLFFYEPAGADDQATRAAINAARTAGPGVRLFTDTVAHISNYRRVIGSLGISQPPAMVVIDRKRQARLLEGYLDAGTIRQTVRDSL
jgi:hypothetical protein